MSNTLEKIANIQNCKADIKSAIEAKGVEVGNIPFSQYAEKIKDIGEDFPENDVNFYDYDGKIIASYTIEEAKNLTKLPIPPNHPGLTFVEWNWTLNDIKTYNRQYIDVGAFYKTNDRKTHVKIKTDYNNQTFGLYITKTSNDPLIISWGDGNEETITASSTKMHTYTIKGSYEITLYIDKESSTALYKLDVNYYNATQAYNYMIKEVYEADNCGGSLYTNGNFTLAVCNNLAPNIQSCFVPMLVFKKDSTFTSTNSLYNVNGKICLPKSITSLTGTRTINSIITPKLVYPEYEGSGTANALSSQYTFIISLPMSFKLTNANFLQSCGNIYYIDIVQGWVPNMSFSLSSSTRWNADTMVRFFTNLGTTQTAITLTFGSTNLNKLTAEQKAIATNKGYTLA